MSEPEKKIAYVRNGARVLVPEGKVAAAEKLWADRGDSFHPAPHETVLDPVKIEGNVPSKFESLGRGVGQGASVGAGDEMGGFGGWLAARNDPTLRSATRGTDAPVMSRGEQQSASYAGGRNAEREANAAAQQANPKTYFGGELIGGAAPATALGAVGGPLARAAQLGSKATAVSSGAIMGGANAAGLSTADTLGGVAKDTAAGTVTGAALGHVADEAAPLIAQGANWVGGKLRGGAQALQAPWAEQKLAAAGAERGALRKLRDKPGGLERYAEGAERMDIGRNRLGVVPASVRQHANDADLAAAGANARKNALATEIGEQGSTVHGADVAARVRKLADSEGKGPAGNAVRNEIHSIADEFEAMGEVPFAEMNAERQSWGKATNFDAGSMRQNLRKKVYSAMNETMEHAANRPVARAPYRPPADETPTIPAPPMVPPEAQPLPPRPAPGKPYFGPEYPGENTPTMRPPGGAQPMQPPTNDLGTKWRGANEDEHIALKLGEIGTDRLNTAGNRVVSPSDMGAGMAGYMAAGDPITAGAAVLANKALRSREHAMAANGIRGVQNTMRGAAGVAEKLGATQPSTGAAQAASAGRDLSPMMAPAHAKNKEADGGLSDAMQDPQYGRLLSGVPDGEARRSAYMTLQSTDPKFRQRMRDKARTQPSAGE